MPRIGSHVFNVRDFVKETTQTSGAGAYTLDGVSLPEEGHQSFLTAVGDGGKTFYGVKRGSTWEKAIGTVSAGASITLSRDRIVGTSVDDSMDADPIDWPTTDLKDIYIGDPADLLNLIQGPGQVAWDTVAGGNNALTLEVDPLITVYFDGMVVWFRKGDTASTANMTLNVNSIGAKSFLKSVGVEIPAGEAAAHALMGAVYVAAEDAFVAIAGVTPQRSLLGTELATTSGTTKDFTGIRSDAKKITIMFDVVSLSGTDHLLVRLGTAGGFVTSGYGSDSVFLDTTSGVVSGSSSAVGFLVLSGAAVSNVTGHMTLTKIRNHVWISSHSVALRGVGTNAAMGGGISGSLGGALTQLRIMASGSNTFDAGAVNVFIEYD